MSTTELSDKMRALAKTHKGRARAAELVESADAFDNATTGFYSVPQTVTVKAFMGFWARARKLWCDVTGEPLI